MPLLLFPLALSVVQGAYVSRQPYSLGWKQTDTPVRSTHSVSFTVVVKEQGAAEIRRIASEVSDPDSPIYGQYLSQATVDDITRPAAADMAATRAWLDGAGVAYTQRGVSNLDVECPAVVAELLLATKYHVVAHAKRNQSLVRAGDFSVPESVQTVFGLHGMPLPPRPAVVKATQPVQSANVTPNVIWSTYSVSPQPEVTGSSKNRQAVAEFEGQFMNSTDLKAMFKQYVPAYNEGVDDVITNHHGKFEESSDSTEAELDIQYIMGVAPGVQTEFWAFPGQDGDGDFGADLNMWTSNLTSGDDVPLVHSVSYGWQGNLSQIGVTQAQVDVVDGNFAKLAAKGVSIMISSGDSGSGDTVLNNLCEMGGKGDKGVSLEGTIASIQAEEFPENCCTDAQFDGAEGWTYAVWAKDQINETTTTTTTRFPPPPPPGTCTTYKTVIGTGTANATTFSGWSNKSKPILWASWPASSPWVTAVGATRFVGQQVGNAEMATDSFGSGGGFYSIFTDDNTWQTAAVAKYLSSVNASTLPPASSFCATCRATPDVAALGEGYQVVVNGHVMTVGGTSASTPAFAAIVSLLNEARLKAGKPSMGFLNPFLYKNEDAFTDVVLGSNKIDNNGFPLPSGFDCSAGWDPVTGLGTPRYDKLLAAAMA